MNDGASVFARVIPLVLYKYVVIITPLLLIRSCSVADTMILRLFLTLFEKNVVPNVNRDTPICAYGRFSPGTAYYLPNHTIIVGAIDQEGARL